MMIDKREFRNTLGRFATGITIVTTVEEDKVHGMTANAFLSVSLDPPLVLVSIDHKAKMHQLLPKTHMYGISILREDQEAVSQHFAGRPQENAPQFFWKENFPFIKNSIAQLACEIVDEHPAGDHTLYIGQVKWLSYEEEGNPLLFYAGKYRKLDLKGEAE
ncbi:flavin reductase family protein [Aeribacillus pallidus]|uniref:flavin reductase family protein n=1 Tax=Aeribacillus pallidus TaxID=33936 RepID=UPI0019683112|nr:flavin reductase family protein [Aeribacillus pallidus]